MKLYRNIIIIVVVLGILISGLVLVNKSQTKKTTKDAEQQKTEVVKPDPITVMELDGNSIVRVAVKTENEDYTITKSNNKFSLSDSKNIKVGTFAVESVAMSYAKVEAYQLASEKAEDVPLYGFDAPKGSVTISLSDGKERIIYIGNEIVGGNGNYIKLANENKIYGMSKDEIDMLVPAYEIFVDTNIFTFDPAYTTLSYFEINKSGNTPYRFDYFIEKKEQTTLTSWKMTKPIDREANVYVISENIITPLESFGSCVAFDAAPKDLSSYGFDNPYATFTIATAEKKHSYVFGGEDGDYRYFMADDYLTVYKISKNDIAFLDIAYIDLIGTLVHVEDIKHISKVEVKTPDVDYVFEINGENRMINGKTIGDSFSKAYEAIIGMSFESVNAEFKGRTVEATIKFTRNDGTTCTLSYLPVDDLNYIIHVDGSGNTVISKSAFNEAMNIIKKIYDEA